MVSDIPAGDGKIANLFYSVPKESSVETLAIAESHNCELQSDNGRGGELV